MDKKIATRQSYGEKLTQLGKINKDIVVLDADLATATKTELFKKEFPNRFFDMGIAEQDMMSTAAGMATCGKIPYASTFAMFAATTPSRVSWRQTTFISPVTGNSECFFRSPICFRSTNS